jgi:predicted O-methyltransferase YrrM
MQLPDGWLPDAEVRELQRLAEHKTVLELGAWKGRSTVALSRVARYVVSVDRHQGIPGHDDGEDTLLSYLDAVRPLANVAVVVADFGEFCPFLCDSFDLVFVDGDHDAESVARDTRFALGCVAAHGGQLVFHDWDFSSVVLGAGSIIGYEAPDRVVGSLASFRVPVL